MPEPDTPESSEPPVIEFGPRTGWHILDLRELWRYRQLFWILGLRDVKVRYKQTAIGALWAILQPVMIMIVFSTLFRLMGRAPAGEDLPYTVTLYTALLPWQFFSTSLTQSANSLVTHQNMVKKIYFPRAILPASPIVSAAVDFAIAFLVLIALMIWHGLAPTPALLALPGFVLLAALATLALGLWFSALNALYRDLIHAMPFLIQLGFFVSPVIFETREIVPAPWWPLYGLNPMAGVIEGFRWALLGAPPPPLALLLPGIGATGLLLIGGMFYFRRMERTFVDRV